MAKSATSSATSGAENGPENVACDIPVAERNLPDPRAAQAAVLRARGLTWKAVGAALEPRSGFDRLSDSLSRRTCRRRR
jgi:hypothetical protein